MHGTIQTPKPRYDRRAIMTRAAEIARRDRSDLAGWQSEYDREIVRHAALIARAETEAETARAIRYATGHLGERPEIRGRAECLRQAWSEARYVVERARAEMAAPSPRDIAIVSARMADHYPSTLRELSRLGVTAEEIAAVGL